MRTEPEILSKPHLQPHDPASVVHRTAARGLAQLFGLHPIPAVTALAVNAMLFAGELATMGALVPVAFVVAIVLGAMTFICQRRMYGDDDNEALVKALAVGLLTAIPTGLPGFLTVPSAVVGLVHTLRRR
jgi:hypothetical protein